MPTSSSKGRDLRDVSTIIRDLIHIRRVGSAPYVVGLVPELQPRIVTVGALPRCRTQLSVWGLDRARVTLWMKACRCRDDGVCGGGCAGDRAEAAGCSWVVFISFAASGAKGAKSIELLNVCPRWYHCTCDQCP